MVVMEMVLNFGLLLVTMVVKVAIDTPGAVTIVISSC